MRMVEKWIHRECERDVADLVQPTEHRTGERCAVCGRTFGAVWLNEVEEVIQTPSGPSVPYVPLEVEEAVSEPIKVVLGKTETSVPVAELEVTIEAEVEIEPELEVVAVLEEAESIDEAIDRIAKIPLETIEEALEESEKETEIARLKAQLEALEK